MSDDKNNNVTVIAGPVGWLGMWMFTIGFAHLGVGQALLALVIWPYYVGANFFQ